VACLLAGGVLLLPALAAGCAPAARRPGAARLAAARLSAAPGHAVVAAAGVLTSVALAVAMAIMVASFRDSVDQWLGQILPADLYVRAGRASGSGHLDEALQARIAALPGVGRVDFIRHDTLRLRPAARGPDRPPGGGRRQRSAPGGAGWCSGHAAAHLDLRGAAGSPGWQPGQQVDCPWPAARAGGGGRRVA
jgi:putative ABC transport system permease protein